ncbi:MAG TPA: hypothetical protein VGJ20_38020 [Xanthobacteraceae bacterium]
MPSLPPTETTPLAIEDSKTITVKPDTDPLQEALDNFERALQERNS